MKSLSKYLIEKLVINKNTVVSREFIIKLSVAQQDQIKNTLRKGVEKKFNNGITLQECRIFDWKSERALETLWKTELLPSYINNDAYEYMIEEKSYSIYQIYFSILGLANKSFEITVLEGHLTILGIYGLSAKQRKQLASALDKYYFKLYDIKKYPFNNGPIFITDNLTHIEDTSKMIDIIYTIGKALNAEPLNTKLGPGEVLPGWTIDDIKNRYRNMFDDIRVNRAGNINLGYLRQSGYYDNSKFRIDVDITYRNGVMIGRRKDGTAASGNNFVLEPTVEKAFDELDRKLQKRGYSIK